MTKGLPKRDLDQLVQTLEHLLGAANCMKVILGYKPEQRSGASNDSVRRRPHLRVVNGHEGGGDR